MLYQAQTKDLQDLINQYERDQLELNPAFQRASVWSDNKDRPKLIDSILRGYPLPAIFLSRRARADGYMVYDVIDGKQRIETILRFTGHIRGHRFAARVQLPKADEQEWVDWKTLCRRQLQHLITHYKVQIVEVEGSISEVMDLFIRINSTGKALTGAEKRHAKYNHSPFLKRAMQLASKLEPLLVKHRIISTTQATRMKHVELVCELMLSAHEHGVLNKKSALDKLMGSESLTSREIEEAAKSTLQAINRVRRMLPNLTQTRFHQLADFYTIVVLLQQLEHDHLALADQRAMRLAGELLTAFSDGVDALKEKQRRLEGSKPEEELYRRYLVTVKEGTDEINHRRDRSFILSGLIQPLFETRDERRLFSPEQRRILWNQSDERRCSACKQKLTWDDFTIDHIRPWSKAGKTELRNAALMCAEHNSKKGNRGFARAA